MKTYRPIGVLAMSYGSPACMDEVREYYTDIRHGRQPSQTEVEELMMRYEAIGGLSPLSQRTQAQLDGLAARLEALYGEGSYVVAAGTKHSKPSIEDGISALGRAGVRKAVGLVLAPHYSAMSVGEYERRAIMAARAVKPAIDLQMVRSWHLHPGLITLLAARVREAFSRLDGPTRKEEPAQDREGLTEPDGTGCGTTPEDPSRPKAPVLFSAHSLPIKVLTTGDAYPAQLRASATAIADLAGVTCWRLAWQSAGRSHEPWIGPDLSETVKDLARNGTGRCVVCPQGFVSDHLEILYDIDILARNVALAHGLELVRTASLNDDPQLIAVLADVVATAATSMGAAVKRSPFPGSGGSSLELR